MDLTTHFANARELVRTGQREEARAMLTAIVRAHPAFAPAWLWLSGVVSDPARQRECLERVLALDPENAAAKHGMAILDLDAIMASVSFALPITSNAVAAQRIGDYLVSQNFISKEQLDQAVAEQKEADGRGRHIPLGDLMVRHGWLSVQVLAKILEQQREAREVRTSITQPLGQYLIEHNLISPDQLKLVLDRQNELRRNGQHLLLGELMVSSGMLSRQQLDAAIEDQRVTFYSMMGD